MALQLINGLQFQINQMLKDKDSKQSIQVTIRVRPLSQKELNQDGRICVKIEAETHSIQMMNGQDIKKFTFDSICWNETQQQIFDRVGKKSSLDCLEGYNCTIFAYGQTGAGKTYTMMGINHENERYFELRGLIPRTLQFLFACIEGQREKGVNFIIRCSFLEIYNEQIIDLLNKTNNNMQLREDSKKGVYVEGITEEMISRSEEAMEILHKGSKSRHVGSTTYNDQSSRSHSVFTMQIQSKYSKNGVVNTKNRQFNFIDLAGSERTKQSTGDRLKQGCNINKSLMNLAGVINSLSEVSQGKSQHVNYRNSKLTFLLKDSLGGNSKTNLIANISPCQMFYHESVSTLGFARRAKLIKRQKASINEDSTGNLQSMKNQIKRLKQEIINLISSPQINISHQLNSSISQSSDHLKMAGIMHELVSEETDKQTKFQLQILKLNDRIQHLQKGIKAYSENDIHLRLIIDVYEDKITRLVKAEKILSQKIEVGGWTNINEEDSKKIIDYFDHEREELLQEVHLMKKSLDSNKYIKELMKAVHIYKDQADQETLKSLLHNNTNFLTQIKQKLQEIQPQKVQVEFTRDFEQKVTHIQIEFAKKEEEFQQRVEQLYLQINQLKMLNQENDNILKQSVNVQIILQQKLHSKTTQIEQLNKQLQTSKKQNLNLKSSLQYLENSSQQSTNSLKIQLSNKQSQLKHLRNQYDSLHNKYMNEQQHLQIIKQQFVTLEVEKIKLDKIITCKVEELKSHKNQICVLESQIQKFTVILSNMKKDQIEGQDNIQRLMKEMENLNIQHQHTLHLVHQNHNIILQKQLLQIQGLSKELQEKQSQTDLLQQHLIVSKQQINDLKQQLLKHEDEFNNELATKQQKIEELIKLINEKEMNGNETSYELNQIKLDLINLQTEKEENQIRFKKSVKENQHKLDKQMQSYRNLEHLLAQKNKLYQHVCQELLLKKKQCGEVQENLLRMTKKCATLTENNDYISQKLEKINHEYQCCRDREKQLKISCMEAKNQLFLSEKKNEVEIQSLKGYIESKDQQIQQLQKEILKNKLKNEKCLEDLQKQIINNKQQYQSYQESQRKILEMQNSTKEKKINELKMQLLSKEFSLKQSINESNILKQKIENDKILIQKQIIEQQVRQKENLSSKQQYQNLFEESESKYVSFEQRIEELQIQQNEQLNKKDQQIYDLNNSNQELLEITISQKNSQQILSNQLQSMKQELLLKNKYINEQEIIIESFRVKIDHLNTNITLLENKLQNQQSFKESFLNENQIKRFQSEKNIQNQVKELNEEIKSLSAVILKDAQKQEDLTKLLNQNCFEKAHLEEQIAQLRRQQFEIKLKNVSSEEKNSLNQQKMTLLQNDLKIKIDEIALFTIKLTQSEKDYEDINKQLANIFEENKKIQQLSHSLEKQVTKYQENQKNTHFLENDNANLLLRLENITNKYNDFGQEIVTLKENLQISKNQIEEWTLKYISSEEKKKKLEQFCNSQKKGSQQLRQKINCSSENINSLESFIEKLKLDIQLKQLELKQHRKQMQQLSQQIKQIQSKKNYQIFQLQKQNTNLTQNLDAQQVQYKKLYIQNLKNHQEHQTILIKLMESQEQNKQIQKMVLELSEFKENAMKRNAEIENIKKSLQNQMSIKSKLALQILKEKQMIENLKMLIENSENQVKHLEMELEEKDNIYKKLLQKIAKNDSENKRISNSEHYLKTVELLQKSRAQSLQLRKCSEQYRKQNEEIKRQNENIIEENEELKGRLNELQNQNGQMQQKSETYCRNVSKRLEELSKQYEKQQQQLEKTLREKKSLGEELESQKEAIQRFKLAERQVEHKIKNNNQEYLQLQKEYQELKKCQFSQHSTDEKTTNYINKLKLQNNNLRAENNILVENLSREKEEKLKLKTQIRYGKDNTNQISYKLEIEKKSHENKYYADLILEITTLLKIPFAENKSKWEVLRASIIRGIRDINNEILILKDKCKDLEKEIEMTRPVTREYKALSITNNKSNYPKDIENLSKPESSSEFLNHTIRNKISKLESNFGQLRQSVEESKNPLKHKEQNRRYH